MPTVFWNRAGVFVKIVYPMSYAFEAGLLTVWCQWLSEKEEENWPPSSQDLVFKELHTWKESKFKYNSKYNHHLFIKIVY